MRKMSIIPGFFLRLRAICAVLPFTVIVICFACYHEAGAEEPLISVVEAAWTERINADRNPAIRFTDSVEGMRQLSFWTRIRGSEKALAALKKNGKLPIRHKWYLAIGPELTYEQSDAINLAIGNSGLLNKLTMEVKTRGYFDWRTWSMKKALSRGSWMVQLVYSDNEPVLCNGKPCEYAIDIQ